VHDVGERTAAVLAAELRDRAEGAAHVAALGNLHVRVGHAGGEQSRRLRVVEITGRRRRRPVAPVVGLAHEIDDALEPRRAQDGVDLRHLALDLEAVALRETAGDDQRRAASALLELGQLQDRVDRFLARAVDEGARVDAESVGILGALSWIDAWTLTLLSLMRRTISLAFSVGIPCWSVIF